MGSGEWYRYGKKQTIENYRSLDVNWLNRRGYLMAGSRVSVHWSQAHKFSGSLNVKAIESFLILDYKYKSDDEWESITESILLSRTRCNYGGTRTWFICPGVKNGIPCQRRVTKLYLVGKYFCCRHCYELVYESQRELKRHRFLRIDQKIRMRLGGSGSISEPFPLKPKGMHWKTYNRLRCKAEYAEHCYLTMLDGWIHR